MAGRRLSPDGIYARELGVPVRQVKRHGGEMKLRALDASARNLLLGDYRKPDEDVSAALREIKIEIRKLHILLRKREAA